MSDFVLLYHGGSMPDTEEGQKQAMDAWGVWFGGLGSAVKDPGNPMAAVKSIASDGAVSEAGDASITGYTVLTADSVDHALALAKGCPVLHGGASITVYEAFNIM